MKSRTIITALLLCSVMLLSSCTQPKAISKDGYYYKEMTALHNAIEKNYHDQASDNYLIALDPAKWDRKGDYVREYAYFWAFCAMYQAANEIEKLDPQADIMAPMLKIMERYSDPTPPVAGYSDYIMSLKPGERYYDDNQWIGITALDAYERTGKKSYLKLGKDMYDFMMVGYDNVLGGGIYWKDTTKSSKNTCSNGPGVLVALQMYKATKDKTYLDVALKVFNWTNEKLKSPEGLYYDAINTKDSHINKMTLSYNTGTMLESYIYLYELTGQQEYLTEANRIADSSLEYFYGNGRFRDDYWFNAVLLRAYQHLLKHNPDLKYIQGFKKALDYALANEKTDKGLFRKGDGLHNLVDLGGMLEILARYAWLENSYQLTVSNS